jgi:hypothetical protein
MSESQPPQNADNHAHFAYYDKAHEVSFVWAGDPNEQIEVCPGGYAEPVQDTIDPRDYGTAVHATAANWMVWFRTIAQAYITRRYGDE